MNFESENKSVVGSDLTGGIANETCRGTLGKKRPTRDECQQTVSPSAKKARHAPDRASDADAGEELRRLVARQVLVEKFGHESFLQGQEAVVDRVLAGHNTLVVAPSGVGKSLCYQIPAIAFEEMGRQSNGQESGITVVVSPRTALMKDRVAALRKKGVAATFIPSTGIFRQLQQSDDVRQGKVRVLYCGTGRLHQNDFVEAIKQVEGGVRLVAVDEVDRISEKNHPYLPEHVKVAGFAEEIRARQVLCLASVASSDLVDDICKAFRIPKEGIFRTPPYRPNLRLGVKVTQTKRAQYEALCAHLRVHPGPALVFVAARMKSEELATKLNEDGFSACFFHSSMKPDERDKVQADFLASRIQIVVSTILFGLEIVKSDIRSIIHSTLPSTIELYCRQVHQGGRDGQECHCMLYLCSEELITKKYIPATGRLPSRQSVRELFADTFDEEIMQLSPGDIFKMSRQGQSSKVSMRKDTRYMVYQALG